MRCRIVYPAWFSPAGTTRTVVERVAAGLGEIGGHCDLLEHPPEGEVSLPAGALLVAGAPVYAGRLPAIAAQRFSMLKGNGTPAVALAVYGNREYEDALLELCDILEGNGFWIAAAGAAVGQHSIFPNTAAGRPDEADLARLDDFARSCVQKLEASAGTKARPAVKGTFPYRKPANVSFYPVGSERCTGCGACSRICPAGAIDPARPRETDKERCIPCGACIRVCPTGARAFRGPVYTAAKEGFGLLYKVRKEPEFFL